VPVLVHSETAAGAREQRDSNGWLSDSTENSWFSSSCVTAGSPSRTARNCCPSLKNAVLQDRGHAALVQRAGAAPRRLDHGAVGGRVGQHAQQHQHSGVRAVDVLLKRHVRADHGVVLSPMALFESGIRVASGERIDSLSRNSGSLQLSSLYMCFFAAAQQWPCFCARAFPAAPQLCDKTAAAAIVAAHRRLQLAVCHHARPQKMQTRALLTPTLARYVEPAEGQPICVCPAGCAALMLDGPARRRRFSLLGCGLRLAWRPWRRPAAGRAIGAVLYCSAVLLPGWLAAAVDLRAAARQPARRCR